MGRFQSGDFNWKNARKAFFDGFHASLAAYANAGNNLILEHILDTDGWMEVLCDLLEKHNVFFVAVHCPIDVLTEREHRRGDRPVGSARRDFETIHVGKLYDLELDGRDDVNRNVEKILSSWRSDKLYSIFCSNNFG